MYIYINEKIRKLQCEPHLIASEHIPDPVLSAGSYESDKFQNTEFVNHLNKTQLPKKTS
jgi:hypothetical protein